MKFSISLICTALLLAGCPDSKLPKVPPSVPVPKADVSDFRLSGVVASHRHYGNDVMRDRHL